MKYYGCPGGKLHPDRSCKIYCYHNPKYERTTYSRFEQKLKNIANSYGHEFKYLTREWCIVYMCPYNKVYTCGNTIILCEYLMKCKHIVLNNFYKAIERLQNNRN